MLAFLDESGNKFFRVYNHLFPEVQLTTLLVFDVRRQNTKLYTFAKLCTEAYLLKKKTYLKICQVEWGQVLGLEEPYKKYISIHYKCYLIVCIFYNFSRYE